MTDPLPKKADEMIASGILRANEAGLLTGVVTYEEALKVAVQVLETLDAWDCAVTVREWVGKR